MFMLYYGISILLVLFTISLFLSQRLKKQIKNSTIEPNHLKEAIQNEDFLHNLNNILEKKPKQSMKKFTLLRKKWLKRKKFLRMQGMSRNLNHKKQK